ncbi:SUMF1/EgtB/PvdO family nonheme iron enzyme [Haliscomenobacter hydrossis]|uniref:Sulphatase-modifying factor protein n=1 Tax=Haliscomenobacter hydrossis (strain ATCC 27775 / DSM 1100 / LMG 10767 / O) TaxID=760192 RepID=F4KRA2_HALH1|nr:SUMF1/EgtB/PvdO family nonheme iron enzyme [Haliscomenobacter hydrossis]AEE54289.1 Sulphatase-modifying factor protein [Haliscomenobacter hydrossis DSM 1100]
MLQIPRIFIAYARQDLPQLEQLRTQLRVLERREFCHIFYDGVIQAGEKWEPRIKEELHRADIYLLLVTAEFLDSNYVNDIELPTILQREREGTARVLPVILRQCLWKYSELEVFQAILYEDRPIEEKKAYGHVAHVVATEVERLRADAKPLSSATNAPAATVDIPSKPKIDLAQVDPFHSEMIFIKGGSFEMGAVFGEGNDAEKPVHTVHVNDFYLARYTVTQTQWEKIMGYNPSHFKGNGNLPVETVNWDEAQEFIRVLNKRTGLNYRLPSESEWEYAARERGDKVRFGNGKNIAVSTEINFDGKHESNTQSYLIKGQYRKKTTPVGSFPANHLGLYDLSGNLWEWCADVWHDNYQGAPLDSSAWMEGGDQTLRVFRGGSWIGNAFNCRATCRNKDQIGTRYSNVGFRVARS